MTRAILLSLLTFCLWTSTAVQGGTFVRFRTVFGDTEVELLDQQRPVAVKNFLQYVRDGAYAGMFFHRMVPDFVIQGGGFVNTAPGTTNSRVGNVPMRAPITNEFGIGPLISNVAGTIAMAKSSDPNSATSQFFFNLADNSNSLDSTNNSGGFTVFGRVVGGTNTLVLFNSFVANRSPATNVIVNANSPAGGPFGELPVLRFPGATDDLFTLLVYVDISLMNVQVARQTDGARKITWDSAVNATNVVEFTSVFPPVWTTLTNVVRPTATNSVVVDSSGDLRRFYRVRTAY